MYFKELKTLIQKADTTSKIGKIENVIGMTVEASGVKAGVGDICIINESGSSNIMACLLYTSGFISSQRNDYGSGLLTRRQCIIDHLHRLLSAKFE